MATIELGGKVTNQASTALEGLTVQLYTSTNWEATGAQESATTTDADGLWAFSSLVEETYIVVVHNADSTKKLLFDGRNEAQFKRVDIRSTLQVDTINEATSASGVTIDSMVIKDGGLTTADAAGAAVLSEAATSTNPTLIPNQAELDTGIGWASDTLHFILGGANKVQVTTAALSPGTSDDNALGTASLMWSDLFLASLGVINFNNGNMTITHGAGTLTVGGGNLITTLGAVTLAGAVTGGDQAFTAVGDMTFTSGSLLRSGSTNGNTLLLAANDTTFITLTTDGTDACDLATTVTMGGNAIHYVGGTDVALADGGTGASLSDPGADRLLFWDDSATAVAFLTLGTGLSITTTTLNASVAAITQLNAATENELVTVGNTTTELDAEANLKTDGNILTISGARVSDDMGIFITNTDANATSDAIVELQNVSSGGSAGCWFDGTSSNFYYLGLSGGTDTFVIGAHNAKTFGSNDMIRFSDAAPPIMTYNSTHPTGTFDYVCDTCGKHSHEKFACCGMVRWHDDILAVREAMIDMMTMPNPYVPGVSVNVAHMVRLGVMEYDSSKPESRHLRGPWLGIDLKAAQWYTWASIWQNRQRMDYQHYESQTIAGWHEDRLDGHDLVLDDHEQEIERLRGRVADLEAQLA